MRLDRAGAQRVVLLIATGAALAAALGSLAAHAWWLELFSHFRPQYAVVLAASALALALLRMPGLGLACLALAAANGASLLPYYVARPAEAARGGAAELKLVALNLYQGNTRHQRVIDYLQSAAPDVAVLVEVTPAWRSALESLRDEWPHQAWAGEVFVVSRLPLAEVRALPPVAGSEVAAMLFAVDLDGQPVTVVGAHAHWPLGRAVSRARNLELRFLASVARATAGPLVIVGDLNTTGFSPWFRRLLVDGGLTDCSAGRGWRPTWPARMPLLALQIDHCLHSDGLEAVALGTGPYVGSDHYPLEATLRRVLPPVPAQPGITASRADRTSRR